MEHFVYHYHPISRVYLGQSIADHDPLEPTRFLIPACATEKPLPELKDGEVAVFDVDKDEWLVNLAAVESVTSPKEKRKSLLAAVAARRFAVETAGINLPSGIVIGTDREDQAIITSAVSAIQFGIKEYDWKGTDGTWIKLSAEQVNQIGAAVAAHVQACFTAERKHSEAIAKLNDDELDSYDINTGWPE